MSSKVSWRLGAACLLLLASPSLAAVTEAQKALYSTRLAANASGQFGGMTAAPLTGVAPVPVLDAARHLGPAAPRGLSRAVQRICGVPEGLSRLAAEPRHPPPGRKSARRHGAGARCGDVLQAVPAALGRRQAALCRGAASDRQARRSPRHGARCLGFGGARCGAGNPAAVAVRKGSAARGRASAAPSACSTAARRRRRRGCSAGSTWTIGCWCWRASRSRPIRPMRSTALPACPTSCAMIRA